MNFYRLDRPWSRLDRTIVLIIIGALIFIIAIGLTR